MSKLDDLEQQLAQERKARNAVQQRLDELKGTRAAPKARPGSCAPQSRPVTSGSARCQPVSSSSKRIAVSACGAVTKTYHAV